MRLLVCLAESRIQPVGLSSLVIKGSSWGEWIITRHMGVRNLQMGNESAKEKQQRQWREQKDRGIKNGGHKRHGIRAMQNLKGNAMDVDEGEVASRVNVEDHSIIMESFMTQRELNKRESNRWGSVHSRIVKPSSQGVGNGAGRR